MENNQELVELNPRIRVEVNGESKEIFMSEGLCSTLAQLFTKQETPTSELYLNPELRQKVLVICLADRDKRGTALKDYTVNDFEMTVKQADEVYFWAIDHILDFFIQGAQKTVSVLNDPQSRLIRLMPSENGTRPSAIEKHSAGPSDAEKATSNASDGATQ